jgi:hypothetical protein
VIEPPPPPGPTEPHIEPIAPRATTATTSIGGLSVGGALATSVVRQAIARLRGAFPICYRTAAERAGEGTAQRVGVRLTVDEMGRVSRVAATGGGLPGLNSCVTSAVRTLVPRRRPDVGVAQVSFYVAFAPARADGTAATSPASTATRRRPVLQ